MNQILSTTLNNKKKKNWFRFQFGISIFIILILICLGIIYYQDLSRKEKISDELVSNYNIYKLYSNQNSENTTLVKESINGLFRNYRNTKIKFVLPYFF